MSLESSHNYDEYSSCDEDNGLKLAIEESGKEAGLVHFDDAAPENTTASDAKRPNDLLHVQNLEMKAKLNTKSFQKPFGLCGLISFPTLSLAQLSNSFSRSAFQLSLAQLSNSLSAFELSLARILVTFSIVILFKS